MGRRVGGRRVVTASIRRRLFWPALTTALILSLTLSLGVWQVRRLHWKQGLLAEIEAGEAAPAVALPADPQPFRRYTVSGTFIPDQVRYGAEVRTGPAGATMGSQRVGVLLRAQASPVVVDRGWAVEDAAVPPAAGVVEIGGYIRPPEHTPFMGAADNAAARRFFALDPLAIGAALGQPGVAPYTLVEMGPAGQQPEPVQTLPRPPNDHLTYAITWFSLSVALIAVFVVYSGQTIRRRDVA